MKKYVINWKKTLTISGGLVLGLAPIAVAVSCGESSSAPVEPLKSRVNELLKSLKADATSTNAALKWNDGLKIIDGVTSYRVLSGNYMSVTEAKAAPASEWKAALPTTLLYNHSERYLWVEVTPVNAKDLPDNDRYIDLTTSSNIREVKSAIETAPGYVAPDLSNLEISGQADNPLINEITIPSELTIEFQIKSSAWLSRTSFIDYLKLPATRSALIPADYSQIKARLAIKDATKFAFGNVAATTIKSSLNFVDTQIPQAFITALNNIQVSLTAPNVSLHNQVTWLNQAAAVSAVPTQFMSAIEFYVGAVSSPAQLEALPATEWKSAATPLPQVVSAKHDERNVWVRFIPVSGVSFSSNYYNLTATSRVRDVKTELDIASVILNNVKLGGIPSAPVIKSAPALTGDLLANANIKYQIKSGAWQLEAAFINELKASEATLVANDYATVRVQIAVQDSTKYVLNSAATEFAVDGTEIINQKNVATFVQDVLKKLSLSATSRHNNLEWLNKDFTLIPAVTALRYYSGAATTEAEVSALPDASWTAALPSQLAEESTARNFWVKVTPINTITLPTQYFNLTATSGVRNVLTEVSTVGLSLSNVALAGTPLKPIFANEPVIPATSASVIAIKYQINNGAYLSRTDMIAYLTANAATLTNAQYQTLRAKIDLLKTAGYVLSSPQEAQVETTIFINERDINNFVDSTLSMIAPSPTSKHNSVVWQNTSFTLIPKISAVKYYIGLANMAADVSQVAENQWIDTLPSTIDEVHGNRNFWARITPTTNVTLTSPYYDLTTSSKIRLVKTEVNYTQIDTSLITLSGTPTNVKINSEPATALPSSIRLAYSFNNGAFTTKDIFINTVNNFKATQRSDYAAAKVRLEVTDETKYLLVNSYEHALSLTSLQNEWELNEFVKNSLMQIKPTSDSNSQSVVWTNVLFTKPSFINAVSFYVGEEASADLLSSAAVQSAFSTSLPTNVNDEHAKRHLWARFTPESGITLTSSYVDLTVSSQVQGIKTLIDTSSLVLSNAEIGNTVSDMSIKNLPSLSGNFARLQYRFQIADETVLLPEQVVSAQLMHAVRDFAFSNADVMKVYLVAADATKYVVSSDQRSTVKRQRMYAQRHLEEQLDYSVSRLKANANSVHNSVSWFALSSFSSTEITNGVRYYYGAEESVESVALLGDSVFTTTLPSSVNYDHEKRNLFVQFVMTNSAQNNLPFQRIFNITTSSEIRSISSSVDYELQNLTNFSTTYAITVDGTYSNPTFTKASGYAYNLPKNTEWTFNFAGLGFLPIDNVIRSMIFAAQNQQVKPVTYTQYMSIQMTLASSNQQYKLLSPVTGKFNFSASFMQSIVEQEVQRNIILISGSSTKDNLIFTNTLNSEINKSSNPVATISYYYGSKATPSQVTLAERTSTLPTTLNNLPSADRHLFVFVTYSANNNYTPNEVAIDITTQSQIRLISL